jgi:tripeptide aminopeptidase
MSTIKKALQKTFLELIDINEVYPHEKEIITYVTDYMSEQGIPCKQDAFGNVICTRPGVGEPLMINTHLDIPEPADTIEYTIQGDTLRSNGKTILGADPKSGLAVILELVRLLGEKKTKYHPIEFVFTLGEEAGLIGAQKLEYSLLRSKMGLVIDEDGPPTNLVAGAVGDYDFEVTVHGKTVHSRDWKEGINAIEHISRIIPYFKQGEIVEGVTSNIGKLHAGTAKNSTAGEAKMWGEFRSFDMNTMKKAIESVEKKVTEYALKNDIRIDFLKTLQYTSYMLDKEHTLFKKIETTYDKVKMKPTIYTTFGASDANVFNANGIQSAAIGSGYYLAHQYNEYVNFQDMEDLLFYLEKFVQSEE